MGVISIYLLLASIVAMFPMPALSSPTPSGVVVAYDGCKAYENPSGDIYVLCENETKELLKEEYIPPMRVCGKRCVIIITERSVFKIEFRKRGVNSGQ